MKHIWIKDLLEKALYYSNLYSLLDGDGYSQRLKHVEIADVLPGKEKFFCALLIMCGQEFKKADAIAIVKAKIKDIQEEIQILQEKINLEENEEKRKKLNEELDNIKEMGKALHLLELEAEESLRIKLDRQYKEFLEKKHREKMEEEEKMKIAAMLIEHFSNLEKSKTVYIIELEPGFQLNIEAAEIFKRQKHVTSKYFNCDINEIEYHIEKRKIVHKYVEEQIDNLISRRPASDRRRLNKIKLAKLEPYVSDIYHRADSEQRADENYSKLLECRIKLSRSQAQKIYIQEKEIYNQENEIYNQEKTIHIEEKVMGIQIEKEQAQIEKEQTQKKKKETQLSQSDAKLTVDKDLEIDKKDEVEAHHEIVNEHTKEGINEKKAEIISIAIVPETEKNKSMKEGEEVKSILENKEPEKKQSEFQNKEARHISKRESRFTGSKNRSTLFSKKHENPLQPSENDSRFEDAPRKKAG